MLAGGTARRVSELTVLTDELLGVSIAASSLTRQLSVEKSHCIDSVSSAELPSGLRIEKRTMENASEWELGGFRFNIPSSRLEYDDWHPVTKEQMAPVPEVLQGAE